MILLEDTRNQLGKHDAKHSYFEEKGITIRRTKLYVGDYTLPDNQSICIDTKKDIQELVGDICGKSHERFRDELLRAQEAKIRLIILVENKEQTIKKDIVNRPIFKLEDLHTWKNPRLFIFKNGKQAYPRATKGITLQKACYSMQRDYGAEFLFTTPDKSGEKIIELLTGKK